MTKLQRLRNNIAALKVAFNDWNDPATLAKYSGFGGLTFILNPLDKAAWSKSDLDCYEDTVRLHELLHQHSADEKEQQAWVDSLKSSTLTAFYTPTDIVRNTMHSMLKRGEGQWPYDKNVRRVLDPAAGANGVFAGLAALCVAKNEDPEVVAYEKDLLSGLLLKAHHGDLVKDIRVTGFETIPDTELGQYDLVTTNVPFGNIRVYDHAYTNSKSDVRRDAAKMIHRYYVLKGLDCLRHGGLLAYIITSNWLNRDSEQVAEALKTSRLIGAYRLAGNLFKDNGTEAPTDLVILQKDEHKGGALTPDEGLLVTTFEADGAPGNLYFEMHPDRIIATDSKRDTDAYGKPAVVYTHKGGVEGIAKALGEAVAADVAANLASTERPAGQTCPTSPASPAGDNNPKAEALKEIFKLYTALYEDEAAERVENMLLRLTLNAVYDDYVAAHGPLNSRANAAVAKEAGIKEVLALEVRDGKGWRKADIMERPVAFAEGEAAILSPQEALACSLNRYGRVDMPCMTSASGLTEDELTEALAGEVFWNPLNDRYETKAQFVCGNVVEKMEEIKRRYAKPTPQIEASVKALEAAVPEPIPFELLDFNLGERWVDAKVYSKFATEFFTVPDKDKGPYWSGETTVTVHYEPTTDQYSAEADNWNEKIRSQFAVRSEASADLSGIDLLVHALLNTCPKVMRYKRDKEGRYIRDNNFDKIKEEDPEKTQLANAKIEEIRRAYIDWLLRQPKAFRDELAEKYNRRFNCFVKPKYDGGHQTFPGVNMAGLAEKYGVKSIYQSQKDCVWMLLLNGGGICDHEVGSGKTLIMCLAAHEMKRLGVAHKPMIIGLKANVSAIAETYRTAYPQAKVLFATEADYCSANREDFFNRAKTGDWDCIIMSHDQFGFIPQSEAIQVEMLQDEMRQIDDAIKAIGEWGWQASSRVKRGLETRKKNMAAKILALQDSLRRRRDSVTDFDTLGIDHIFVDESHQFKNLGFSSRHDRVAGMGNTEGSKRAYNLLMAIRTIQKKTGRDLGATFLSGTTVTNSLTELYGLFRYLRPKALAKQGITCFDAWAAIFARKSQEFEFSITNQIVLKERFRYFIKVPELAMMYNEITDYRTAEDVGIDRPAKNVRLLNLEPTPDQQDYIATLMEFAKTGDFSLIGIDNASDKQKKAKMLYATDKARKMSLDMRMIDPSYEDHPRSKASQCAALVKEYYDRYDEQKGTQLIFSDLSTWQNNQEWSVYGEIKRKLVEQYGIPAEEVRFIQECKSDAKKQALIKQVNEGKVRVLFGSTSMLGTGVNAQQRIVAVHHLDTPWRPSDLEQRDGRAIRKGNEVAKLYADNKVDIIVYAVERSLDSYKFNLLHCKQTFISQLKRGQVGIRTLDEGAFDENTGMNFAEYMAILSGNTDLLERARLEKKIAALESERKSFARDRREQQDKQEALRRQVGIDERNIADAKADWARYTETRQTDDKGNVVNPLTMNGAKAPEGAVPGTEAWDKAQGERMIALDGTARTGGAYAAVGSICGLRVLVKTTDVTIRDAKGQESIRHDNTFYVESAGGHLKYRYQSGGVNRVSARLTATHPMMALERIPKLVTQWEGDVKSAKASIAQLDSIIAEEWPKEEELDHLRRELTLLDQKINSELKGDSESALPKAA